MRNTAAKRNPLSATRQGLQKYSIVCLDVAGRELGTVHGGETLELIFPAGDVQAVISANGEMLRPDNPLVPPGTVRMVVVAEAGRGGW